VHRFAGLLVLMALPLQGAKARQVGFDCTSMLSRGLLSPDFSLDGAELKDRVRLRKGIETDLRQTARVDDLGCHVNGRLREALYQGLREPHQQTDAEV